MRETQDVFFDERYWKPAFNSARQQGISTPLGITVVYDSLVHGAWIIMRKRTNEQFGSISALGEQGWIKAYVQTRRNWLSTHSRADLRPTAYRMDAFQRLIELNLWGLELPLIVRGNEISLTTLSGTPKAAMMDLCLAQDSLQYNLRYVVDLAFGCYN